MEKIEDFFVYLQNKNVELYFKRKYIGVGWINEKGFNYIELVNKTPTEVIQWIKENL